MKHLNDKSALYCPPVVEVLAVATEGVLCGSDLDVYSIEGYSSYDGNKGFGWEE